MFYVASEKGSAFVILPSLKQQKPIWCHVEKIFGAIYSRTIFKKGLVLYIEPWFYIEPYAAHSSSLLRTISESFQHANCVLLFSLKNP